MIGPPQPPSWELQDVPQHPDISDDESEGDEFNVSDKPISLAETRRGMESKMGKKVRCELVLWEGLIHGKRPSMMDTPNHAPPPSPHRARCVTSAFAPRAHDMCADYHRP